MKFNILILAIAFFTSFSALPAITSRINSGDCAVGSDSSRWTSTWTYDDDVRPLSGSGIKGLYGILVVCNHYPIQMLEFMKSS